MVDSAAEPPAEGRRVAERAAVPAGPRLADLVLRVRRSSEGSARDAASASDLNACVVEGDWWHCAEEDPSAKLAQRAQLDATPLELLELAHAADVINEDDVEEMLEETEEEEEEEPVDDEWAEEEAPAGETQHAALQLARSPLFHNEPWPPAVAEPVAEPVATDAGGGDAEGGRRPAGCTTCSICIADFDAGQEVTTIASCGHRFHLPCLQRWMEAPPFSCPVCRADAAALQAPAAHSATGPSAGAHRHGWQPLPKRPTAGTAAPAALVVPAVPAVLAAPQARRLPVGGKASSHVAAAIRGAAGGAVATRPPGRGLLQGGGGDGGYRMAAAGGGSVLLGLGRRPQVALVPGGRSLGAPRSRRMFGAGPA